MPLVTIVVGALLPALGILGYVFSESHSVTALIPVGFGSLPECVVLSFREARTRRMAGVA